jgi:CheY-like chemotaxis protein
MTDVASDLRGRRILIVEDDYFIASDLAEGLAELGATVLGPSGSVKDALRHIAANGGPDAAVLDINLGREQAFPVADALLVRNIPFLFATGYSGDAVPPAYGTIPRCQKPIQSATVAKLLANEIAT